MAPYRVLERVPVVPRVVRGWVALRPVLGGRMWPIMVLVALSVVSGLVEAAILALLAEVAAAMVVSTHGGRVNLGPVHMSVGASILTALVLTLVRVFIQLLLAWLPTRLTTMVQAQMKVQLFEAFTRASWAVKANTREGHFQELMTNQVNQAMNAVGNMSGLISSTGMFLALVASAFSLSWVVAALVLVTATLLFASFRPFDHVGRAAAAQASQTSIDQAGGISEAVRLAEEAQVFGVGGAFRARMRELVEAARVASYRARIIASLVGSLYSSAIFVLIVAGIGGLYVARTGHLASLGAVILILVRASSYGQGAQSAYHLLIQVLPFVERLRNAVDRYNASAPTQAGDALPPVRSLVFDQVTYSYRPGEPVLRGISFEVEAGEAIGIIGPTGAGKSTVSQLLLRLREPDSGAYLINGTSVRAFALSDWHHKVAYVSQEPRLYTATVADNIRFFRDIDQDRVEHAARLAYVHDEIMAMPHGYDTVIGQQTDAVSGGQRQRICLARALVGDPQILLLDEPTSQLDLTAEAAIEASIEGLHGKMMIFIIAHRLSVLRVCHRVLVLEQGRVTAFAPVSELAHIDGFYQRVSAIAAGAK
jgi:ATP-binding cassette subfamily B protein